MAKKNVTPTVDTAVAPTTPTVEKEEVSSELKDLFRAQFDRICNVLGVRTQVKLADILGIRQSSISDAKRRASIPSDWTMKLFRNHGVNPDYVSDGTGPVFLRRGQNDYTPHSDGVDITSVRAVKTALSGVVKPILKMDGTVLGHMTVPMREGEELNTDHLSFLFMEHGAPGRFSDGSTLCMEMFSATNPPKVNANEICQIRATSGDFTVNTLGNVRMKDGKMCWNELGNASETNPIDEHTEIIGRVKWVMKAVA